ncbi:MAG: hypothetical protein KatS3mg003_0648 [Candidatus Nitrosocaldaceae archaeon]|nr:MAG: hypothetical protein KatS3mg003_0648 [Candidatus Nitrosocaldaceae archaeon]
MNEQDILKELILKDYRYYKPWKEFLKWEGSYWDIIGYSGIYWEVIREFNKLNTSIKPSKLDKIFRDTINELESDERFVVDSNSSIDNNKYALNVINGLLIFNDKLEVIKFISNEEKRGYYPIKCIHVNYNPSADCKKFKEWLGERVCNDLEEVKRALGSMLFNFKRNVIIFWSHYEAGKTTLINILVKLLGADYITESDLSYYKYRGDTPYYRGQKVVEFLIFEYRKRQLKRLLSISDGINILFEAWGPEELTPIFYANTITRPKVKKEMECYIDNVYSIRFRKINNPIIDYHKILLEEREGIFNFMLEGAREYADNNYKL